MSAPELAKPTLARHDVVSGVLLSLLGAAVLFESWRMPRLEERGIDPWTAPGIVPGFLGAVLAVLGAVLALRGLRQLHLPGRPASLFGVGDGRMRFVMALLLNLAFALVLVGRMPFWLATLLYLVTFMAVFGLQPGRPGLAVRAAMILVVAAAATAGIVYLFQTLFLVRLP